MLLDTTFLVDLQRELSDGRSRGATSFLEEHPDARPCISLVTWMEFAEGYPARDEEACRMFLARFPLIVPDPSIAWRGSRIARDLRAKGSRIGDHDIWIAATAIERALSVVTRNPRHFERIAGLRFRTY